MPSRPRSFRCCRCMHSFGHRATCQECGVGRGRQVRRCGQLRLRLFD